MWFQALSLTVPQQGSSEPYGGLGIVLILLLIGFYFLPSIIGRKKRNRGAIFALNLFLGWTLIGWVVSLVWALTHEAPSTAYPAERR
jgi:hypothetical protein